jgi:hypothetical protein
MIFVSATGFKPVAGQMLVQSQESHICLIVYSFNKEVTERTR